MEHYDSEVTFLFNNLFLIHVFDFPEIKKSLVGQSNNLTKNEFLKIFITSYQRVP